MAKETSRDREFLMLAFVSFIIVIALFVAAPFNESTGHAAVTHSSTGTVWTCTWDNGWKWMHVYSDGTEVKLGKIINAESSHVNCDPFYWSCAEDNVCDDEGKICTCRKQLETVMSLGSSG